MCALARAVSHGSRSAGYATMFLVPYSRLTQAGDTPICMGPNEAVASARKPAVPLENMGSRFDAPHSNDC